MNPNKITELTQRVIEFYSRLCPAVQIEVHLATASFMHEGRTIREGEFLARVVIVNANRSSICTLVEKDGKSPEKVLAKLFESYDGPIFKAIESIGPIESSYRDLIVVELPKKGTKEFEEQSVEIETFRSKIKPWISPRADL